MMKKYMQHSALILYSRYYFILQNHNLIHETMLELCTENYRCIINCLKVYQ